MGKIEDNEAFVRIVQSKLNAAGQGLKVDGWAGKATIEAFDIILGRAIAASEGGRPPAGSAPTYDDWSIAQYVGQQSKAARPIEEIIVHCAATPEGKEYSVATIRQWHKARGFNDIGYHYVVHLDGSVEAGRPESLVGAHTEGHNTGTLGICYVGGVDAKNNPKDTRTPQQKESLEQLCKALIAKYPTIKKISGHNQYAAKACPSFDVRKDPLGALV